MKKSFLLWAALMSMSLGVTTVKAWDYEGHRLVNELALSALPTNFPAFVKTPEAQERIAFLAGEPDRWRNVSELNHDNTPDHYIDLEEIADYGIDDHKLPHYRYDFVADLALARAAHPEKFKPIPPEQNRDHTRQLVGLLPYAIMENFEKLRSEFSYLKTFEKVNGTADEIANAQRDIIYTMGILGHYVGDGAQPLHTTKHFNGWVGEDPQNYTREKIHSKVDSYFLNMDTNKFVELKAKLHPAMLPGEEPGLKAPDMFDEVMNYLFQSNEKVVPLYELEKSKKLFGTGDLAKEGNDFLVDRITAGGQMLGDLYYAAWQQAGEDIYLAKALNLRKLHAPSGAK